MGMFITKYLEKYIQLFFNPIRIKVSFESAFLQFSEEIQYSLMRGGIFQDPQ